MKKLRIFRNKKAEGYVDSGVKILIAVVIGALLLGLLYTLFNTTIMPSVTNKVEGLFDYSTGQSGAIVEDPGTNYRLVFKQDISDGGYANFCADVNSSKFDSVQIDGVRLDTQYYTMTEGNQVVVSLNSSCASTLSTGSHTLRIVLTDGYCDAPFEKR